MASVDQTTKNLTAQAVTQPFATVTTIEVSNVSPADSVLPEVPYKVAIDALLSEPPLKFPELGHRTVFGPAKPIEACTRYHGQLVAEIYFHPFVAAVDRAFNDHRPLVLSPDMLWLLVAQGFANHVNADAKELRPKFVQHCDKSKIMVRRDDFIKGSPENPWAEVLSEFSSQIREHIGPATHDLLVPTFSTTGTAERAATEVVLLDAMQSFFSYELDTECGIPQIVLEGAPEDWITLAERTNGFAQFNLQWWTAALGPILEEFVATSRGQVNERFWQSIYKIDDGSGGPYTTGWINAFFPYLNDYQTGRAARKNPWLIQGGNVLHEMLYPPAKRNHYRFGHGPTIEEFPAGLSRAPFTWKYLSQSFEMEFLSGFVGVGQNEDTLGLRPEIGWAVREQEMA